MLMRQPGSVNEGSLGALMRQPGSVNEGSLGILQAQPGSYSDGSLGILMAQPKALTDGVLGALIPTGRKRRRHGVHGLGADLTWMHTGGRYAARNASAAAASRQASAMAASYAKYMAARSAAQKAASSATFLHGLGAPPAAIAARMSSATNRGICLSRCKTSPNFAGCVKGCVSRYPLQGLGAITMPSWGWMAGGVVLLGAVAYLATKR
jgi:hypothetical protein